MKEKKKYCFIFGEQRTGSTLIHRAIGSHPDIIMSPNDFNLTRLCSGIMFGEIKQIRKFVEWNIESFADIETKNVKCHKIVQQIVDKYIDSLETKNKTFLHKTPKEEDNLETYRKAFKDKLNFIFILRNPAAIIYSRKGWKNGNLDLDVNHLNINEYQNKLKNYNRIIERILRSFQIIDQNFNSSDTIYTIKYEHFIDNPDYILEKIFGRLNLPSYSYINLPVSDSFTSNDEGPSHEGVKTGQLDPSKKDMWKNQMNMMELRLLYNEMLKFYNNKNLKNTKMKIFFKEYLKDIKDVLEVGV